MKVILGEFDPIGSFGIGLFETIPYFHGKIPFVREHLERLSQGITAISNVAKTDVSDVQEKTIIDNAQHVLGSTNGVIRLVAKRSSEIELHIANNFPYTKQHYIEGFSLNISNMRKNEFSPYTSIKTLNYLENFLEREKAKAAGFNDMLFLNTQGFVAETTSANIFLFCDDTLYTPSINQGILPGIIRAKLIAYAKDQGLAIIEGAIKKELLNSAQNVCVTNSLLGIMQVKAIDEQEIPSDAKFQSNFCNRFCQEHNYLLPILQF